MRILLAALRCDKGAVGGNLASHVRVLREAASASCDLAVFPEMSLTGSVDPAAHPERLIGIDDEAVSRLARESARAGVAVCFGIAERAPDGVPYITQVCAADGKLTGFQRKRYLGEGEEAFSAGTESTVFRLDGVKFGIAICAEAGFDAPFDDAAAAGARLMLFPAAPGLHGRRTDEASWRSGFSWWQGSSLSDASRAASRLGLWIALAGQAGSTTDEDFPGLAGVVSPDGSVTTRLPDWREGTLVADIPL